MITQHATGKDICPVKAWKYICKEATKKKGPKRRTVNWHPTGEITYKDIEHTIKSTAASLQEKFPSMNPDEFGTHSVRCGAALAMYLSGTAVIDIMLQGRWSSDAFLLYIKRQVLERSSGISSNMIKTDNFVILPSNSHAAILDRSKTTLGCSSSSKNPSHSPNFHLLH